MVLNLQSGWATRDRGRAPGKPTLDRQLYVLDEKLFVVPYRFFLWGSLSAFKIKKYTILLAFIAAA
ncbi:MAG: hypothetical protein AAGG53_15480 [Cyanobacteria bacterium P01_H01_bin.152]